MPNTLAAIEAARYGSSEDRLRCFRDLVGSTQGWLHGCREAVTTQQAHLLDLTHQSSLVWAAALIAEQLPLSASTLSSRPAAIVDLAAAILAAEQDPPRATRLLHRTAAQWQRSLTTGLARSASPEAAVTLPVNLPPGLATVMELDAAVCAPLTDLALWLRGTPIQPLATCTLPILLDHVTGGLVADLRLELVEGLPPVCYPAPVTMTFCALDGAFSQAIATAEALVQARGLWPATQAVRWQLQVRPRRAQPALVLHDLRGSSAGLGFALALLQLLTSAAPPLQHQWAVTGALENATGSLTSVQGYAAKLDAAAGARLHVLYPAADQAQVTALFQAAQLQTFAVDHVDRALAFLQGYDRPLCPYRGLDHFTEADAPIFFGRRAEQSLLCARIAERPRLLALLGGSGSGKSSLVHAGLLARLAQAEPLWDSVVVRLADQPLLALAEAGLLAPGDDLVAGIAQRMRTNQPERHLLIVFDQFEELLVLCPPDLRERFFEQLQSVLAGDLPITFLLVMRNDFYSQLNRLAPWLMQYVAANQVHLPDTLSPVALTEMIKKPAEALGVALETGLTEWIIADVLGERAPAVTSAGAILPLLEFTLTCLWEQSAGLLLTYDTYNTIGGISGALVAWGTTTLERLPEAQRALADRLLLEFVQSGNAREGLPDSRRRRTLTALCDRFGPEVDILPTLQHLVAKRLLIAGREGETTTFELIHDTLVREWPYLRDLLEKNRRFLAWKRALEDQLARWQEHSERPSRLLPADELPTARYWRAERGRELGPPLLHYLAESEAYWRQRRWRTRLTGGAIVAVLMLGLFATLLAYGQVRAGLRRSDAERMALTARQLLSQRPEPALQQAIIAFDQDANPTTEETLHAVAQAMPLRAILAGHTQSVMAVAVSPDGQTLATAGSDRSIILWDLPTGQIKLRLAGHTDQINALAFSPDGELLASAAGPSDRTIRLWDTTHGELHTTLRGHTRAVVDLAFSPDGRWLASLSGQDEIAIPGDGTVRIWDLPSAQLLHTLHLDDPLLHTVRFSPDGSQLVSVSRTALVVWQPGQQTADLQRYPLLRITSADLSPDGQLIALGRDDGRIFVNNVADPLTLSVLHSDNGAPVTSLRFSYDGAALLSGHSDGQLRWWDLATRTMVRSYQGHSNEVLAVSMSRDGTLLISGGRDRQVRLWAREPGAEAHPLIQVPGTVHALAFSPTCTSLALATSTGQVQLYDLMRNAPTQTFNVGQAVIQALAFSPDERLLALGDRNGRITLWDRETQQVIHQINEHQGAIQALSFHLTRPLLASISTDDTLRLWDQRVNWAGRTIHAHRHDPVALAFSPDAALITTASRDQLVRRWHSATGSAVGTALEFPAIITALTYDQSGWLHVGLASGDVRSFDPQLIERRVLVNGAAPLALFSGPDHALLVISSDVAVVYRHQHWPQPTVLFRATQPLTAAALSPDRQLLALGDGTGQVRLILTDPHHVRQVLIERLRERR